MKFGTQIGSLGLPDNNEALQLAADYGCVGLEVGLGVADEVRTGSASLEALKEQAASVRQDFEVAGMEIISLTPGLMLKHVQCPEAVKGVCEVAQEMGAKTIRMFGAPHVRWGGPNSELNEWMAEFDGTRSGSYWMKRNIEELGKLLELSEGYDLRYVFELHHGYVANSASGAMRMIDRYPPERVGILMDPGNMVIEGGEGWRNSVEIMGEYLSYVHCKNAAYCRADGQWTAGWASLADGIANYPEIITAMKDLGFDGYLSIEDLRKDVSPKEKVADGIAYLKGLVEASERVMPI